MRNFLGQQIQKKEIVLGNNEDMKRRRSSSLVKAQAMGLNSGPTLNSSPILEAKMDMELEENSNSQNAIVSHDNLKGSSSSTSVSTM